MDRILALEKTTRTPRVHLVLYSHVITMLAFLCKNLDYKTQTINHMSSSILIKYLFYITIQGRSQDLAGGRGKISFPH